MRWVAALTFALVFLASEECNASISGNGQRSQVHPVKQSLDKYFQSIEAKLKSQDHAPVSKIKQAFSFDVCEHLGTNEPAKNNRHGFPNPCKMLEGKIGQGLNFGMQQGWGSDLNRQFKTFSNNFNDLVKATPNLDPSRLMRLTMSESGFDNALRAALEMARKILEVTAEPLELEYVNLTHSDSAAQITGYVRDIRIEKLSLFSVDELHGDLERLTVSLQLGLDKVDVHATYDVDAWASGQLHLYGNGSLHVRATELNLTSAMKLGYQNEHFYIRDMYIYISMDKLKVILENFLGGGKIGETMSHILSDVGPHFLNEYREEVSQFLSSQLQDKLNALLQGISLDDILGWISGTKPLPIPP